jgi:hypothetical protein
VTVRHVALVATKCRYCGSVRVLLGGRLLKKVNLQSNVKRPSAMIHIASLASSKTGRLTVKVRSQGRTTKIDGLAVSGL